MSETSLASTITQIKDRILKSKKVFIAGHQGPDFDSVCACLALSLVLRQHGKTAFIASDFSGKEWDFFQNTYQLEFPDELNYDLAILLDYGNFGRVDRRALNYLERRKPYLITIDHHQQQSWQGDLFWVDEKKSSTCEMVYDLFESLGWKIDDEVAFILLLGICYDTNIFVNMNVTQELLNKVRLSPPVVR